MKCPACKKRLSRINSQQTGEYICPNDECPANKELWDMYGSAGHFEFYGTQQEEINTQWPLRPCNNNFNEGI